MSEPQAALARAAGGGGRAGRQDRHPRHGLPRDRGRDVRRDRLDRDGRARGQRQHRRVSAPSSPRCCKPGGRLLNHGIARLRVGDAEAGPFSERYVFPDAAPLHLSRIQSSLERAGLHTRHVEDFPDDYARTLLEWQRRFEANIERARELGGDERVRVWRIYLRVSRQGFESGFMSVYQVRAVKPD